MRPTEEYILYDYIFIIAAVNGENCNTAASQSSFAVYSYKFEKLSNNTWTLKTLVETVELLDYNYI